jgi:hypothetical protein
MSTEQALSNWRYGQTMAERLSAGVLQIDGFGSVDPQHPLGGPDGRKDIICKRDEKLWVAAAYFPTGPKQFKEIRKKFLHDFEGMASNSADGFVFVTNQALTVGERQDLLATHSDVEIYHLERLRHLLDQPKGCGIRLEYLRIPMTEAEQWAFWQDMNADISARLLEIEKQRDVRQARIEAKLDFLVRTMAAETDLLAEPSALVSAPVNIEFPEFPMSRLSVSSLCWVHKVVTSGSGASTHRRGQFRTLQSWIGAADGSLDIDNAIYVPPAPEHIFDLVSDLLNWWADTYLALRGAPKEEICQGLAELHHRLVAIHPFLDGNGRVARVLLDLGLDELLGAGLSRSFFDEPQEYYEVLRAADLGDLKPLADRIQACAI